MCFSKTGENRATSDTKRVCLKTFQPGPCVFRGLQHTSIIQEMWRQGLHIVPHRSHADGKAQRVLSKQNTRTASRPTCAWSGPRAVEPGWPTAQRYNHWICVEAAGRLRCTGITEDSISGTGKGYRWLNKAKMSPLTCFQKITESFLWRKEGGI